VKCTPIVAGTLCLLARAADSQAQAPVFKLPNPVRHLDVVAREPMVAELPNGTLFVAGYAFSDSKLWKSTDGGAKWSRVDVGTEADGAVGNSDVDLAVAPDGTLYYVQMRFDRSTGRGKGIAIGVGRDAGASWRWTPLSVTDYDDRPWVRVSPDGTVHVIWNDGRGVCHAVSKDGGATWAETARISARGGSSFLAIGPGGEIAVRIVPISASGSKVDSGVDEIAVSSDAGATWRTRPAPGRREWTPADSQPAVPRWVEPLAWDAKGSLYSLWTGKDGLWLARSQDQGATWTTWRVLAGGDLRFYPYLVARGRGELAASWFSKRGDTIRAHVARLQTGAGDTPPRIAQSEPIQLEVFGSSARKESPTVQDTGGEYLALAFLRNGNLALVAPIQHETAKRLGFSWWRIPATTAVP
jgi:hypothetical protein